MGKAIVLLLDAFIFGVSILMFRSTGYEALLGHARNNSNVCLADPLVIVDKDDNYDEVIDQLLSNKITKVVVVFADRSRNNT